MKVKSITKDTKFYICERGLFYEGQILEQYVSDRNHLYYNQDIVIDKFIVHYKNYQPVLYFRFSNFNTKEKTTLSVDQLGIYYKIKKY